MFIQFAGDVKVERRRSNVRSEQEVRRSGDFFFLVKTGTLLIS